MLRIDTTQASQSLSLALIGRLYFNTCGNLRETFHDASALEIDRVIVDLTKLKFIDSSGLGVLIAAQNMLSKNKKTLLLHSPTESVLKILEHTNLTNYFTILLNESDCLRYEKAPAKGLLVS